MVDEDAREKRVVTKRERKRERENENKIEIKGQKERKKKCKYCREKKKISKIEKITREKKSEKEGYIYVRGKNLSRFALQENISLGIKSISKFIFVF